MKEQVGYGKDTTSPNRSAAAAAAATTEAAIAEKPFLSKLQEASSSARRRRMEIRRFKVLANSAASSLEMMHHVRKRSRSVSGAFVVRSQPPGSTFSADFDFSIRFTSSPPEEHMRMPAAEEITLERSGSESSRSEDSATGSSSEATFGASSSSSRHDTSRVPASIQPQGSGTGASYVAGESLAVVNSECPPHGVVFICGRRREMEDAVCVRPSFVSLPHHQATSEDVGLSPLHFFGVFDGHGGSQVSSFCKDYLHRALAEELLSMGNARNVLNCGDYPDSFWEGAMRSCFQRIDSQVGARNGTGISNSYSPEGVFPENVGSTAVVALVTATKIIVGNCGDSRAVLSRSGQPIPLSVDHKPDRADETARVEAAGGKVIFWNGYRVFGCLAMSRAIGDRYLKPYVISEPEVTCTERSEDDECLVLASDGLWDVLSNELVCEIVRRCLAAGRRRRRGSRGGDGDGDGDGGGGGGDGVGDGESSEESATDVAAALLTKVALGRGSSDNISVVVIDLTTSARTQTHSHASSSS